MCGVWQDSTCQKPKVNPLNSNETVHRSTNAQYDVELRRILFVREEICISSSIRIENTMWSLCIASSYRRSTSTLELIKNDIPWCECVCVAMEFRLDPFVCWRWKYFHFNLMKRKWFKSTTKRIVSLTHADASHNSSGQLTAIDSNNEPQTT